MNDVFDWAVEFRMEENVIVTCASNNASVKDIIKAHKKRSQYTLDCGNVVYSLDFSKCIFIAFKPLNKDGK